jgi:IMP dehydrogenase
MSKTFYKALGEKEEWPNITGTNPASLTYDDVLLVPQLSSISSRAEVDTSVKFGPYTLTKPIISAPMDTITGEKMARELASLGAIGTIPRGQINEMKEICERLTKDNVPAVYVLGLRNALEDAQLLEKIGAKIILLDIAHGGLEKLITTGVEIKEKSGLHIIAGNIVTYEEARAYQEAGIDIARVGVGAGGLCTTRLVAGTGMPQLSAVFNTVSTGIPVIADQSIKKPADLAKAIAAGALVGMMGSILAGTDETPGEIVDGYKAARGQASHAYMKDNGVVTGEFRTAEGISIRVPAKGPVRNVIEELMGGLRSAMSYAGAKNIKEFQEKAVFCKVSEATLEENIPWLSKIVPK